MSTATSGISQIIRQRIDVAALIPEGYATYRELVVEGLIFFLERLPPHRISAILAEQASLPPTVDAAGRLVALMHHSPTLHKLGQVLARDRRLDPELRKQLQRLESIVPCTPVTSALSAIEHDLGTPESLGITIDPQVLAEASVAVVVPFTWKQDEAGDRIRGVFKVLKPGIADRLHDELEVWEQVGNFLDGEAARLQLPAIGFRETLENVRDLLASEVDLRGEQRNLAAAQRFYGGVSDLVVPRLLPFGSTRITAMERVDGRKVTEWVESESELPSDVAARIVRGLLARVIWNHDDASLFHADPHAGNLCVTPDGKLGVYDWSLTSTLTKCERVLVTRMMIGALTGSRGTVGDAIAELSESTVDRARLGPVIESALGELHGGGLPGIWWLTRLLDRCVGNAGVRFAAPLLLFRKALHSLQGVLADIDSQFDADRILWQEFMGRYVREWPMRAFALPWDNSFPTHVSNAEVQSLMMTLPFAAARGWLPSEPRAQASGP